ncbi:MAG: sigma 54-interacting transcriptional regulator [Syntrophobacteraceae bacterium]
MVIPEMVQEERLQFERLLSDISARFVNIPPDRVDLEIEQALEQILEFFQGDRCALLQILPDNTSWRITHVAARESVPPVPRGTKLDKSVNPWAYDKLVRKREVLSFSKLDDLPAEAIVDRQTWMDWGIRSNLNIPITTGKPVDHIIVLNSVRSERVWPEEIIPRLKLLGEIFANALERRTADQALYESEERLSLAAASADAGLWILEPDKGLVWVTDKLREMFRFEPEEDLSLERVMTTIHPDDHEGLREFVRQGFETQDKCKVECRILLPGGNVRWIVIHGRRNLDVVGLPVRMTGVVMDITERKMMEARLRDHLEEIEDLKERLEAESAYLQDEIKLEHDFEHIIGRSDPMKYVLYRVQQVAGTDMTVLILGETGTGKELIARTIHENSSRRARPMVKVNCAVLPASLIESELFGHEKGAFTGATARKLGRFELADNTTLFLDEIGELPLELQAKLLQVIEEGEFERLGGTQTIKVNARIIAATNRNLEKEMKEGRFRSDLWYRLNIYPITLPPLREMTEDIPQMAALFVERYGKQFGKKIQKIPAKFIETLKNYKWPGNVRELQHVIERAVIGSSGSTLQLADNLAGTTTPHEPALAGEKTLEEMEREYILAILAKTGWKIEGRSGASEVLKVNPGTLRSRMKKLGIEKNRAHGEYFH